MKCLLCELDIDAADREPSCREGIDYHPFCYQLWRSEIIDQLTDAARADPDLVEIRPGVWQNKKYVK